jgi:hypothetical protein
MNAILNAQLNYKKKRKVNIPPFWKFFLRNVLIEYNKSLNELVRKNITLELLNYEILNWNLDSLTPCENLQFIIKTQPNNIPISIVIENKDANNLINLLYGSNESNLLNRELTKTNIKQLEPFLNKMILALNKVMVDEKRSLKFEKFNSDILLEDEFCHLEVQVNLSMIHIYIPLNLFKPTLI